MHTYKKLAKLKKINKSYENNILPGVSRLKWIQSNATWELWTSPCLRWRGSIASGRNKICSTPAPAPLRRAKKPINLSCMVKLIYDLSWLLSVKPKHHFSNCPDSDIINKDTSTFWVFNPISALYHHPFPPVQLRRNNQFCPKETTDYSSFIERRFS